MFLEKKTYNSYNGYNVSEPNAAFYDDFGYLWISGNNLKTSQFVFDKNDVIIQRYDGNSFIDVTLPNFEDKPVSGFLIKGDKKLFYLATYRKVDDILFEIDTENLTFKRLSDYNNLVKEFDFKGYFTLKDNLIFVLSNKEKIVLKKIINNKFITTDSIRNFFEGFTLVPKFVSNDGDYAILSTWKSNFIINNKGKVIKEILDSDYVNKGGNFKQPRSFYFMFKSKENYYFTDTYNEHIFKLNGKTLQLEKIQTDFTLRDKLIHWFLKSEDYFMFLEKKPFNHELNIYSFNDKENSFSKNSSLSIKDLDVVATRDINKELLILYGNTLEHLFFDNKIIKSVLKDISIRSIQQIDKNKYAIATDTEGFYELDTQEKSTKKLNITEKGISYLIQVPRDIIPYQDKYFISDSRNIYFLDNRFKILEKYQNDIEFEEIIKFNDTIFKGGLNREGFLKFSIKDKKYHYTNYRGFFIREFAIHTNLYALTINNGVLEYQSNKLSFYKPENESADNLLSITNDEYYGLLISTKDGKVYQFNTQDKTFSLFFKDDLKASVVGMVSDTTKVLWLNTYAGIVSYNPNKKIINRFKKEDGIYELEGNRYSTYKDKQGNIFMGSFKGLHYFNPYELIKKKEFYKLQFSSLSFYDKETETWKKNLAPNYLNNVQEIELPAHSQRFSAKIGLLGVFDNRNYNFRYRLIDNNDSSNTDWNKLYLENEIVFSNLSAGDYTLEVDVLDATNQKIGETLSLAVLSLPFFYETWWFILLTLLVLVLLTLYILNSFKTRQKLYTANKIAVKEAKIKETMMLEIHHRIKNNLQVVSGLLSIQAFNSTNNELKEKLKDSQSRIESIAGIHNILYSTNDQEMVFVKDYFQKIIDYNKTLFAVKTTYFKTIEAVKMSMDTAIPLALILNELINNSHKHAFANQQNPEIYVSFKKTEKGYIFSYSDNGIFVKKETETSSMGMKIIHMMTQQLKANSFIDNKESFTFKLELSLEKK